MAPSAAASPLTISRFTSAAVTIGSSWCTSLASCVSAPAMMIGSALTIAWAS
jgi:hypothetical protein